MAADADRGANNPAWIRFVERHRADVRMVLRVAGTGPEVAVDGALDAPPLIGVLALNRRIPALAPQHGCVLLHAVPQPCREGRPPAVSTSRPAVRGCR